MSKNLQMQDFHWLMDILQNIDVGLIVLDTNYRIHLWNAFMENHSGIGPQNALGNTLYDLFPDIDKEWLAHKIDPVFQLKTPAFILYQQRPYLFRFPYDLPITGRSAVMYQNISILPLVDINQVANHVCLMVYDVTELATKENGG